MKTTHNRHVAFAALFLLFAGIASAQTYLGNAAGFLNGVSNASTFEVSGAVSVSTVGWSQLTGVAVQAWDSSTNGVVIDFPGGGFNPYSVQFVTTATWVANSTYTLSLDMGYVSGPATGNANYSFSLGSWDGATFTPAATDTGGPVFNNMSFASGNAGLTRTVTFTTGASVSPTDFVAIQWAQTNTTTGADFFGFDNVVLSYTAVPEPSTCAAVLGAGALGLVVWRRRSRRELPV